MDDNGELAEMYRSEEQKPAEWSEEKFESVDNAFRRGRETGFREGVESVKQSAEWSEEDKEAYDMCYDAIPKAWKTKSGKLLTEWLKDKLKSLRPQPREEIYQSAKHDLAIRFMNYLDENRPEGKMGLSNGECEDIDKAFKENDWAKIMRYVEKYRPSWKPSEEQIEAVRYFVNKHQSEAWAATGQWKQFTALRGLLGELQKLK